MRKKKKAITIEFPHPKDIVVVSVSSKAKFKLLTNFLGSGQYLREFKVEFLQH
jgi:hypothetical protein